MTINIPKNVDIILDTLNIQGYDAYIVGGCVRDSLLHRIPNDWDICTNATPTEMLEIFKDFKVVPTGLKHGTITVVLDEQDFEVTTYRIDGDYSDGRRPDVVFFTDDIVQDLSRRDFTINAMAYNRDKGLVDPFNGLKGLEYKSIECVGNPHHRIKEDGLRMLRAVRFATQLNFVINIDTSESIYENRKILKDISSERIREEFNKILLSDKPSKGIDLLRGLHLLEYIIPEILQSVGFDQSNRHHDKSVYSHTMTVLDITQPKLELRLAALFHDIGKPNTFTVDEDGSGHFYGHHKESAKICRKVMQRLKYSNNAIEYVSELVYYHMTRYEKIRTPSVKRFINKVGIDKLDSLFELFVADRIGSKPPYEFDDIYKLKFECERILSEKQPLGLKDLAINGNDLMQIGVPQGREIGYILSQLLDVVLDDFELNDKNALLEMAQTLAHRG